MPLSTYVCSHSEHDLHQNHIYYLQCLTRRRLFDEVERTSNLIIDQCEHILSHPLPHSRVLRKYRQRNCVEMQNKTGIHSLSPMRV